MPATEPPDRPHAHGHILAFDFGMRHIGIAVGQSVTGTASPLTTVRARDGIPDWDALLALVRHWAPHVLLVGLPLNMDGTASAMSASARRFGNRLGGRTGVPVRLVDERLTSREAESVPARAGTGRDTGRPRNADRHAIAAVLIAESWLRNPD